VFRVFLLYHQVTTSYIAVIEAPQYFETSVNVNLSQILNRNKRTRMNIG